MHSSLFRKHIKYHIINGSEISCYAEWKMTKNSRWMNNNDAIMAFECQMIQIINLNNSLVLIAIMAFEQKRQKEKKYDKTLHMRIELCAKIDTHQQKENKHSNVEWKTTTINKTWQWVSQHWTAKKKKKAREKKTTNEWRSLKQFSIDSINTWSRT